MCERHYLAEYRRNNPKSCTICQRPSIAKGLCAAHYSRDKRGYDQTKPLVPRYKGKPCSVAACERAASKLGLCDFHYTRQRDGVPLDAPFLASRARRPGGYVNEHGYRVIYVADEKILEHRHVMALRVGRPLLAHESVHHKNGDKLDNRPENLELWSSVQPAGQRVVDKVRWARELLALYAHLVPED
jgi:hypothetical protein